MFWNRSDPFPLRTSRVHEACGPTAVSFALALGSQLQKPVLWVREDWPAEQVHPMGMSAYLDMSRLLFVDTPDQLEALAAAEEGLRSGIAGLVVLEVTKPLSLTAGRRLQLAAQAGEAVGLCLIPEGMGSNAAETRWQCSPLFDPVDSTLQRWDLIKNKSGTLLSWDVRWGAKTRRVIVVSKVGERAPA